MIVRFGFVAMSMQIKNASPSKNMTEKTLKRIGNRGLASKKVIRLAKENLHNTKRILYHALAHDIRFYRFSSRLIPLAAHPVFHMVDFVSVLVPQLRESAKSFGKTACGWAFIPNISRSSIHRALK